MATYTSNLNLKKPAVSDKIRIADFNNNADLIDAAYGTVDTSLGKLGSGMAIISTGNVHAAISAGAYVYVRKHGTLAEGLYTADSAISANATLSSSNVTAASGGGLNIVDSKIDSHFGPVGSSSNPVTSRDSLPLNWVGNAILDSSISPSGVTRTHSVIKFGLSDNAYVIIAVDRYANKMYMFERYDASTIYGWKEFTTGLASFGGTSSNRKFSFSMTNANHAQVYIGNSAFALYVYNDTVYDTGIPSGYTASFSNGTLTITRNNDTTFVCHGFVIG